MKKNAKQDFTPRAEDLTLEDMAKWMEQCAKSARSNDPSLTVGQNRLLTADIRKGYTRIADALRAYDRILKKDNHK